MFDLCIATGNRGKLAELRALLGPLDGSVRFVELAEAVPHVMTIVEDGATFADNARKKAALVAEASGLVTLADDSGLEVDALHGAPGVRSARFARDGATDAENNAALLRALEGLEPDTRGGFAARFRCVLALADPFQSGSGPPSTSAMAAGRTEAAPPSQATPSAAWAVGLGHAAFIPVTVVEGTCEGRIHLTAKGMGGFGYDPLFVVDGFERTLAELSEAEKNAVSHRAKAMRLLRLVLEKVVAERSESRL
jgi:XTP/dITP diphosphohydrolase